MKTRRLVPPLLPVMLGISMLSGTGVTDEHDPARRFLMTSLHITSSELARIDAGQVIAQTLDVKDKREVATIGVVRIRITPEFYVERLTDIATFKRDEKVIQIGPFRTPPHLEDVASLTLDDRDIQSLRECRVGDCGVQLSAHAINRFRQDVNWRGVDAERQANSLMRRILVDYVTGYMKAGSAASMQYADRSEVVDLGRQFDSLLGSDTASWQHFPALRRHLVEYPAARVPGTTDLLYWSKERVGRRTVVGVTHLAIHRMADESPVDYAVASKHIYGTHYFDASLGLTILLRDGSASSPGLYVAYVNRSRLDAFGGLFGGIGRKIVSSRGRSIVLETLTRMQRTLEPQFAASRSH